MMIENPAEWKVMSGQAVFILLLSVICIAWAPPTFPVTLTERRLACSDKQEWKMKAPEEILEWCQVEGS